MMNAVAWLLIHAADAVFWLWGGLTAIAAGLGAAFQALFNQPLCWFLSLLNPASTAAGDWVFGLFDGWPIWTGLFVLPLVAGQLMLIVFRYTSNQDAIGRIKDDMKADLLALKLYKDELRVTFLSQVRLLRSAARLQRYLLAPVAVMLVPMSLGLAQIGVRYQWRPLRVGERANVIMTVDGTVKPSTVQMDASPGLAVEAGPIAATMEDGVELIWRILGEAAGRYQLRFHVGKNVEKKEVVVDGRLARVGAERPGNSWTARLLHPTEAPLPAGSPVKSIRIDYPSRESIVYGADWWIVSFFVLAMAVALLLKPVFKVRF